MTEDIIRTSHGPVRGERTGTGVRFLGIPYARPPIGPLRFAAPVPPRNRRTSRPRWGSEPVLPLNSRSPRGRCQVRGRGHHQDLAHVDFRAGWSPGDRHRGGVPNQAHSQWRQPDRGIGFG
ncbi:carboxylesterase family protein [Streptomyces sp. NPDC087532]|uniref:carboxylesterase family protein n=1 Tax=Streptomyces sp. NPDC087532 TaxID=3365795 RepID=UPI0038101ACE